MMTDTQQKNFSITPTTDPITPIILDARMRCLCAKRNLVKPGAKNLFTLLLDLSLDTFRNAGRRGVVDISAPQICAHLDCSRGVLFGGRRADTRPGWIAQLVNAGFIWTDTADIGGRWDINRYHILALNDPKRPGLLPTRDGIYGTGMRRGEAPGAGFDNNPEALLKAQITLEALRVQKRQRVLASQSAETAENERGAFQKMDVSGQQSATPQVQNPQRDTLGNPQRDTLQNSEPVTSKIHNAPRPTIATPPVQKPEHLRGTRTSLSIQKDTLEPLKSSSKTSGAAQKRREEEFLVQLGHLIGEKALVKWGGWWRLRYREDPDKAMRVLVDLRQAKKDGEIHTNPGGFAKALYESFAGREAATV